MSYKRCGQTRFSIKEEDLTSCFLIILSLHWICSTGIDAFIRLHVKYLEVAHRTKATNRKDPREILFATPSSLHQNNIN